MSYILDALQRAEADRERERGTVPGLQTRAVLPGSLPLRHGPRVGVGAIAAAAAGLAILVAVIFWFWRSAEQEPAVPMVQAQAPEATTLVPSAAITPTPVVVGNRNVAAVAAVTAPPQRPVETPKKAQAVSAPTRASSSATSSAAAANVVPLFKDLPEELRRQVPALAISGAVYSENPAQRLLLVNGQVLSQGSPAAQDVTLEEIHPTTSEFSFKGTRFRLPH